MRLVCSGEKYHTGQTPKPKAKQNPPLSLALSQRPSRTLSPKPTLKQAPAPERTPKPTIQNNNRL